MQWLKYNVLALVGVCIGGLLVMTFLDQRSKVRSYEQQAFAVQTHLRDSLDELDMLTSLLSDAPDLVNDPAWQRDVASAEIRALSAADAIFDLPDPPTFLADYDRELHATVEAMREAVKPFGSIAMMVPETATEIRVHLKTARDHLSAALEAF